MAIRIVGAAGAGRHIGSVLDQDHRTANSLLCGAMRFDCSIPIGIVAATERLAVRKDCKPRLIVGLIRGHNAIHDEGARGLAGTHVVKVAIGSRYNRVVLADKAFIAGVRILGIRRRNLLSQFGHTKIGALSVLIAGLYDNVIAVDVRSGNVVDHLLTVTGGIGVVGALRHARSNGRGCAGKHGMRFGNEA